MFNLLQPRLKEDLIAQIKRQSLKPISDKEEALIKDAILLYNEKKYYEAGQNLHKVWHIESSSLGEIRRKVFFQIEKLGGLQ